MKRKLGSFLCFSKLAGSPNWSTSEKATSVRVWLIAEEGRVEVMEREEEVERRRVVRSCQWKGRLRRETIRERCQPIQLSSFLETPPVLEPRQKSCKMATKFSQSVRRSQEKRRDECRLRRDRFGSVGDSKLTLLDLSSQLRSSAGL